MEKGRFWEIDFLRGIAVVLMIFYHFLFDLEMLNYGLDTQSGIPLLIGRTSAILFVFLVGVSSSLSWSRGIINNRDNVRHFIFRGIKIFLLGLVITVFTYLLFPREFIIFGVLHFIGVAIILSIPFLYYRINSFVLFVLGIIVVGTGLFLSTKVFDFNYLLWLGCVPRGFMTFDYFPIFPWYGITLIGLSFGQKFYQDYSRQFTIPSFSRFSNEINLITPITKITKIFVALGRNSLVIYFIHQPVLVSMIYFINFLIRI